jgi:hypothetical protein
LKVTAFFVRLLLVGVMLLGLSWVFGQMPGAA